MIYVLVLIYTHGIAALIGSVIHDPDPGPLWEIVFLILCWPIIVIMGLYSFLIRHLTT